MKLTKEKQIQIDESLFNSLVWAFDNLDIENYEETFKNALNGIRERLESKQKALEARQAYSGLINATKKGNEDEQHEARIKYLHKRTNKPY